MSDLLFTGLLKKLAEYKKKYYLNSLLRGLIYFFTLTASAYILVATLEYFGKYSTTVRLILLVAYLCLLVGGLVKWIFSPLTGLLSLRQQISDEEAAKEIGKYFPQVQDKLLNTLQLKNLSSSENAFIQASISQKTAQLSIVPFASAIKLKENRKHLRFLIIPTVVIIIIAGFIPELLTESTARIINYQKTYTYPAPFQFKVLNKSLSTFKHEDYELNLGLTGKTIPDQVFIYINGRKTKMRKNENGNYSYSFKNLEKEENFLFEAAGYSSEEYTLEVFSRPDLKLFDIELEFPTYLRKKKETLSNNGNITIPEGTSVKWGFATQDVEKINLTFSENEKTERHLLSSANDRFSFSKKVINNLTYQLELENQYGKGKEKIGYHINVIKDQFPSLTVEQLKDSSLFNFINFAGLATDDYGLTALRVFYKISSENGTGKYKSFPVSVQTGVNTQNFFVTWNLDTLQLKSGQTLEYYLQVWDNDGVNGHKSSKSKTFDLTIPGKEELKEELNNSSKSAESSIQNLINKSKSIKKEVEKLDQKLKTKSNLDWQDKKNLEELLKKHEQLKKEVEDLQMKHEELNQKMEKFNEVSPETKEKMNQLEELMKQLLDEETKKLYEELQKMLEQNLNKEEVQKLLEEMKNKDLNMEKELERSLEWFKQIQFDQKMEQVQKDLKTLSEEQKKLAEETKEKKGNNEELAKEQEKLNEEFKNLEKELEDLKKMNESLQEKNEMKDFSGDQQQIKDNQQKGTEQLKNNQNKKAGESQQKAAEKMEQMAEQMGEMQNEMKQDQLQENMDDLRDILDNLLKLSFDQEALMKDIRKVNQTDPRYLELSQKQLKLRDDSKIIEDSLMALAKRVFQIQSFITRELGEMNKHLDGSIKNIRDRRPDLAAGNQQFTMTSVNNLALMLNDVLKQMQQQMSQMKGGSSMCNKPGQNKKPGLGELQKQLNERMSQMKNGMKPGESMSKELAKMAAQQEMIRNALKELQKKSGGDKAGKELSEIMKQMEQTEKDLVNKRISQDLQIRQKEILTRLLEAEKSLRERDTDNKRESNTGKEVNRNMPPDFEKYLKEKEKQIELLKTVNPSFTPYYKKEVDEYFQKIEK